MSGREHLLTRLARKIAFPYSFEFNQFQGSGIDALLGTFPTAEKTSEHLDRADLIGRQLEF